MINVIGVNKEIADLITLEDLKSLNLDEIKENVIIPSGALVHDKQAEKILVKDGKQRTIIRGPYVLTQPYFEESRLDKEELIQYELKSFKELIEKINSFRTVP